MGGGRGGMGSGMGGYGNTGVNPHFRHTAIGGPAGGGTDLEQEKEELNLRGRVLQEQLENRGGMDPQNSLRIGGNHFSINDPNKPPYTPFYLMVTGHV